jgi:catechol 2,3-dioxygenase-like lactoylglutathione lyase family enzyme
VSPIPPFRFRGLDHVVLRCIDQAAMERFYLDVLGASLEQRQPHIPLTQLRAGASLIDLVPGRSPGEPGRNVDHVCFTVTPFDPDAILAHLEASGFPSKPPASRYGAEGEGPSIYVTDPEGNVVELKGPAVSGPVGRRD